MLTRPCSSRLIFDADARITWPAASQVMPCASRRRRSWLPSAMRSTVGPLATRSGCAGPAWPRGRCGIARAARGLTSGLRLVC